MKISDFEIKRHNNFYYRGNWDKQSLASFAGEKVFKKSIAIVGSRRMTRYGKDAVDKFVLGFTANGITTISGFMYGVDTEVHQKTVDYGGVTVAVFGCGLDVVYPPENEKLYTQILENKGLVISEYESKAKPHLWKFPQRNKIVAGLSSLGVLVIEAGEKSGALITAGLARKMGKKVYAVPGPINSSVSFGTNELIKSGNAVMVTSPSDIVKMPKLKESLPDRQAGLPDRQAGKTQIRLELSNIETKIYKVLEIEGLNVDEVAMQTGESVIEVGTTLSIMGIKGLVIESGGKYYLRK